MNRKLYIICFVLLTQFATSAQTLAPDYNSLSAWAAHPDIKDHSDLSSQQHAGHVDVFFVYPTIYNTKPVENYSADIKDDLLNKSIQESTIFHQASVFHGNASIYAPYYRQMHYQGYFATEAEDSMKARRAFDSAYADVKRAFFHYLKHWNNDRPIVIASHSQGTNHAERLIKEVILPDAKLRSKLKLAYLVGMPLKDDFENFPPCSSPDQLHCFVSWRTYGNGYKPKVFGEDIVCTNPITFDLSLPKSELSNHHGIRFRNGKLKSNRSIVAEVREGCLNIEIEKRPLRWLYRWKNYHVADYNLFWENIRQNFQLRMQSLSSVE